MNKLKKLIYSVVVILTFTGFSFSQAFFSNAKSNFKIESKNILYQAKSEIGKLSFENKSILKNNRKHYGFALGPTLAIDGESGNKLHLGGNVRLDYFLNDKNTLGLLFEYTVGGESEIFNYLRDSSNINSGYSLTIDNEKELGCFILWKRFFWGNINSSNWGFYGKLGIGYLNNKSDEIAETENLSADSPLYILQKYSIKQHNFIVSPGVGIELKLGPGRVYLDLRLEVPFLTIYNPTLIDYKDNYNPNNNNFKGTDKYSFEYLRIPLNIGYKILF